MIILSGGALAVIGVLSSGCLSGFCLWRAWGSGSGRMSGNRIWRNNLDGVIQTGTDSFRLLENAGDGA
jgi:hypothetical protein